MRAVISAPTRRDAAAVMPAVARAACVALLLVTWSCASPEHATQIVLRVRTDVATGTFDSLQTVVDFGDGHQEEKQHGGALPYVAVLSPYAGLDAQVEVTVRAMKGEDAVFETHARARFAPHRVTLLDVNLRQACFDDASAATCGNEEGKTCGGCTPFCVDVDRPPLPDVGATVVRQELGACGSDGEPGGGDGEAGVSDAAGAGGAWTDAAGQDAAGRSDATTGPPDATTGPPDAVAGRSDAEAGLPSAEGGIDPRDRPPVSLERRCVEEDQPCARSVSLGRDHGCVVSAGGGMYCWGDNTYGQLCRGAGVGDGPLPIGRVAEPAGSDHPLLDYLQVAVSARQTCGLVDTEYATGGDRGTVHCCGETAKDSGDKLDTPELALFITNTVHLDVGLGWACAIDAVGATRCFGQFEGERPIAVPVTNVLVPPHPDNQRWTFAGDGERSPLLIDEHRQLFRREDARMVADVRDVRQVSSRGADCVLNQDGSLRCGGRNDHGQLGRGTTSTALEPPSEVAAPGVQWWDVATWERGTCAVARTGDVWCWGDNEFGAMGVAADAQRQVLTPRVAARAPDGDPYVEVEIGNHMTCATRASENVDCWGGVGETAFGPTPTRLMLPAD